MNTKIKKWGNSYGLRLPKAMAESFGIRENSSVVLESGTKGIIIKKLDNSQKFSLSHLVKEITDENQHDEIDFGKPVGREIW